MPTYAIGDVQGCFNALQNLLTEIQFDTAKDSLWFTGDLVNRGNQSLEVLRFVKSLGAKQQLVLGNHDLHLLAVYYGEQQLQKSDTLSAILAAHDCDELIEWLRFQPLLYTHQQYVLVHAGLSPAWTIAQAKNLAEEVEHVLQSDQIKLFLQHMYGNSPDKWDDGLQGYERLRCITNFLTRVRLCDQNGRMNFAYKDELKNKPAELLPWFLLPNRQSKDAKIIFGHWAALRGETNEKNTFALDTGCVWGNCLTAMRLEDQKRFMVSC